MTTTQFQVAGMTCSHCVNAVTEEVTAVEGVSNVAVDLDTGSLTVVSAEDISVEAVREAVEEAGYELVG